MIFLESTLPMSDLLQKLEDEISEDLAWRKIELQNFFKEITFPVEGAFESEQVKHAVHKSLILLLYSQWEGFIKRSAKCYLNFIVQSKVPLKNLTDNFHALALKGNLNSIINSIQSSTKKSISLNVYTDVITDYSDKIDKEFYLSINMNAEKDSSLIDTESNLNTQIYKKIFQCLGMDFYPCLETPPRHKFAATVDPKNSSILCQILDSTLLYSRNHIAHGNKNNKIVILDLNKLHTLRELLFLLMNNFLDTLLSFAENKYFLRVNSQKAAQHILTQNISLENNLNTIISNYHQQLKIM